MSTKLLSFVGVGVCKSGSSTLFDRIITHPEIGYIIPRKKKTLPYEKEGRFFNSEYSIDITDPKNLTNHKFVGEWTSSYITSDECLIKIKEYNPDIKILYMIRHPLQRIWSEYNSYAYHHIMYRLLDFPITFTNLLKFSNREASKKTIKQAFQKNMIYSSMYADHMDRIYTIFPEENVKVCTQDEMSNSQEQLVHSIQDFIGANPELRRTYVPYAHKNRTNRSEPIEVYLEHEEWLKELLYKDNERLKQVYGINYSLDERWF